MAVLIDFQSYPVQRTLDILLMDRSTGQNIIWATDPPPELAEFATDRQPITMEQLRASGFEAILPRMMKQSNAQQERTKKKGEVFTPAWICCLMNDLLDEQWFKRKSKLPCKVNGNEWENYPEKIPFPKGRKWQRYVDSRRLEICCGEAPFLVSRYDASTGEMLPIERRIGILDRKLRVVNENAEDEKEWLKWAKRAIQSTYGYEYQGDNLLLARANIILTFAEYYENRWERMPTDGAMREIAEVISWNLWQMDGLKKTVPFGKPYQETEQMTMFSELFTDGQQQEATPCRIQDWQGHTRHIFAKCREGAHPMKFDFVIGNPPYQDETIGDNKGYAPPVYDKFLYEAYQFGEKVMMIHPARFLFNAGTTPKAWNQQMLNDPHLKVSLYEPDCTKVFSNTDIKGGIAVTYHDVTRNFGAIGTFTPYTELNSIMKTVAEHSDESFSEIVITSYAYHFTEQMHQDFPDALPNMSQGHAYDLKSNILEKLPMIFYNKRPNDGHDYISILGRIGNERAYRFIRREYVNDVPNLDKYKLFMSKANGTGSFGETMTPAFLGEPAVGATETFLSIGSFETEQEAQNALKYVLSKFARALLGVLKVTQDLTPGKFKYVPLQNFTQSSDIDWSKTIPEIDQQLYRKYKLSPEEITFIETHVKEMT